MGQMTNTDIISEALELAGNSGLTARAQVWLNTWLQRVYTHWAWPFLRNHYGPFDIAVGAQSLAFGNGAQTTDRIHSVNRALLTDPVSGVVSTELKLSGSSKVPAPDMFTSVSASNLGRPHTLHVVPVAATPGQWTLYFSPRPSQATRLVLVAQYTPEFLDVDDTPLYLNDETMIQAVYAQALRHQQDERWQAEDAVLRRMIAADRTVHGGGADEIGPGLDTTRFAQRGGTAPRNWLDD